MKNILILVDMQNGFCKNIQTRKIVSRIETLFKAKTFDIVIATRFLNTPDSPFVKYLNWREMMKDKETEIVRPFKKYICSIMFKYSYNIDQDFIDTLIDIVNEKPKQVFIAGVDTDCCVLTTATTLFENGIRPIVLTKYCASNGGKKSHKAGLTCLKRLIGAHNLNSVLVNNKQKLKG